MNMAQEEARILLFLSHARVSIRKKFFNKITKAYNDVLTLKNSEFKRIFKVEDRIITFKRIIKKSLTKKLLILSQLLDGMLFFFLFF